MAGMITITVTQCPASPNSPYADTGPFISPEHVCYSHSPATGGELVENLHYNIGLTRLHSQSKFLKTSQIYMIITNHK